VLSGRLGVTVTGFEIVSLKDSLKNLPFST
jgi:hypothetical protein